MQAQVAGERSSKRAGSNPPPTLCVAPSLSKGSGKRERVGACLDLPIDREAGTGEEFDKTHTEFVFFKASPDESTVEVVFSFPAGRMGNGAEYPGWIPCGAKLDKTQPKFSILEFLPDEGVNRPVEK